METNCQETLISVENSKKYGKLLKISTKILVPTIICLSFLIFKQLPVNATEINEGYKKIRRLDILERIFEEIIFLGSTIAVIVIRSRKIRNSRFAFVNYLITGLSMLIKSGFLIKRNPRREKLRKYITDLINQRFPKD